MENNTNTYIANINLSRDRFDNVLTSLGGLPSSTQDDAPPNSSDGTGNLSLSSGEPPADHKNNHITDISSPTGVDTLQAGILSPTNTVNPSSKEQQQTISNKGVCINKTAVHDKPTMTPAGSTPRHRESILHSSANTRPPDHENEDKGLTTTTTQPAESYDRSQKLFRVFSSNGTKETSYHVIDFAHLYSVWLIVEFSMSPTGNTKDKRMSSFTKCVTALLGKMLYVNSKAMITPIAITDDNSSSFISSKADIPTNFTKLGKHIMISRGSWVFNKKERGNNDVYACSCLKTQIHTEDIIN
jgi:hypothetical protein